MNELRKVEFSTSQLISELLRKKTEANLGSSVCESEFIEYVNRLVVKANSDQYSGREYSAKTDDFEAICKSVVDNKDINLWGREFKYENNQLYATYSLSSRDIWSGWSSSCEKSFLFDYIRKLSNEKKYSISNFDLSNVSKENLAVAKQISSYLLFDLINRYLRKMIKDGLWPKQCRDIEKYIFEKDLAADIELEGTRKNFIQLYKHSIMCVVELLLNEKYFEISNNSYNCLAFSNFLNIVGPFPFISNYRHKSSEINDKAIIIKVNDGKIDLSEKACVFSDSYGEWSDDYLFTKPDISATKYNDFDVLSVEDNANALRKGKNSGI